MEINGIIERLSTIAAVPNRIIIIPITIIVERLNWESRQEYPRDNNEFRYDYFLPDDYHPVVLLGTPKSHRWIPGYSQ